MFLKEDVYNINFVYAIFYTSFPDCYAFSNNRNKNIFNARYRLS